MSGTADMLGASEERDNRERLLTDPKITPLMEFIRFIERDMKEKNRDVIIPSFDPKDGGVTARILFLLEAPGPQAVSTKFVSRDNPDPTARNFNEMVNIERTDTILWNIIPWYLGDGRRIRAVSNMDLKEALPYLKNLNEVLKKNLQIIALVGRKAENSMKYVIESFPTIKKENIIAMPHPSNRSFNRYPGKKIEFKEKIEFITQIYKNFDNLKMT